MLKQRWLCYIDYIKRYIIGAPEKTCWWFTHRIISECKFDLNVAFTFQTLTFVLIEGFFRLLPLGYTPWYKAFYSKKNHDFYDTSSDLFHYRCNRVWVPWCNKGPRRTRSRWEIISAPENDFFTRLLLTYSWRAKSSMWVLSVFDVVIYLQKPESLTFYYLLECTTLQWMRWSQSGLLSIL